MQGHKNKDKKKWREKLTLPLEILSPEPLKFVKKLPQMNIKIGFIITRWMTSFIPWYETGQYFWKDMSLKWGTKWKPLIVTMWNAKWVNPMLWCKKNSLL